jgi:hypothetical protein
LIGEELLNKSYWLPFLTFGIALILSGVLSFFLPYETVGVELQDVIGETKASLPFKSRVIHSRPDNDMNEQPLLLLDHE